MIDVGLADSLLQVAAKDEATDNRLAAIDTLAHLPLADAAWKLVAAAGTSVLHKLENGMALNVEAANVLARIPVRSLREQLGRIARNLSHPASLNSAVALAKYGDAAGLPRLAVELEKSANPGIAERLACLPLEDWGTDKELFAHSLTRPDPMLRFWAAVALARLGEVEPLEQVWDTLTVEPGHFERTSLALFFREPPPIFAGNPWTPYNALKHVRPLPDKLRNFIVGLYENDLRRKQNAEGPSARLPRDAGIFIGGLTGLLDEYGEPITDSGDETPKWKTPADPDRAKAIADRLMRSTIVKWHLDANEDERATLSALPSDVAGKIFMRGLRTLAKSADNEKVLSDPMGRMTINNAVIDLAAALPPNLKVQLGQLLDDEQIVAQLPRGALCWALARAGSEELVVQIGPRIQALPSAERATDLSWARDIATALNAPAPIQGAGPGSDEATPVMERIIDDTAKRARPPVFEGAASPQKPAHHEEVGSGAKAMRPPTQNDIAEKTDRPTSLEAAVATSARLGLETAGVGDVAKGAAEPPRRTVFPDITFSDDNPVAPGKLIIDVSLLRQASATTKGEVTLPPSAPEVVHTFDVHLLAGSASLWDTLEYSDDEGTRKKAHFEIALPEVAGERVCLDVRVNFYLNKRWCGEGHRNVDVRGKSTVQIVKVVPPPDEPEWRKVINIEPGAQPPDLIVRIQKKGGEYIWTCLSPHVSLPQPKSDDDARMPLDSSSETFVRTYFLPLTSKTLKSLELKDVEGLGQTIYKATPPVFKDAYWTLWRAAAADGFKFESIQFVTDEPFIPWELMHVFDGARAPAVKGEFLAVRHCVGRWLATASAALIQKINVSKLVVSGSDYATVESVDQKLPWVKAEKKLLLDTYKAREIALNSTALIEFLEAGGAQAVHIACHGKMSVVAPLTSELVLEDNPDNLRPTMIEREQVWQGLGRDHPLVFLNACEIGGESALLSIVAGFPAAFLGVGAAAVISPLWAVSDAHAKDIAERFYNESFGPTPRRIGEIMRDIRAQWRKEKHLTFLAYVLYGDPMARVYYGP